MQEIEENNRMEKTRDLFKKIRDTREHFMQRRDNKGQKWYKLYKKDLHDPDNHDGMVNSPRDRHPGV